MPTLPVRSWHWSALFLLGALSAGQALAYPVTVADQPSHGGQWQGATWVPNSADSLVSRSEVLGRLATAAVTITATGGDDITLDAPLDWQANRLSLQAGGSIRINHTLNLDGSAALALEWGLSGTDVDSDFGYFLGEGARVNLADNTGFATRRGSDGDLRNYTVVTRLGTDLSGTPDPHGLQWSGTFVAIGADIDADPSSAWNQGAAFVPHYASRVAGLGHTITNLTMRAVNPFVPANQRDRRGGLFTTVDYVQDLGLTNVHVEAEDGSYIGGIAGVLTGRMQNCHVSGLVKSTASVDARRVATGGLVGQALGHIIDSNNAATVQTTYVSEVGGIAGSLQAMGGYSASIERSRNSGAISGDIRVGGIVGHASAVDFLAGTTMRIVDSHNTGTVDGAGLRQQIGGLAGFVERGEVVDSSSIASVVPSSSYAIAIGGLIGEMAGTQVWGSYSGGDVHGRTNVGGLIGRATPLHVQFDDYAGRVDRSFSASHVRSDAPTGFATAIGGLIGEARGIAVSQSFSLGPVETLEAYGVGGLIGQLWPYWPGNQSEQCQGVALDRGSWVDQSYSLSPIWVKTGSSVGGLVGKMTSTGGGATAVCPSKVSHTYAGGREVYGGTAQHVGGLIGEYMPAGNYTAAYAITDSYWDYEYTGQDQSAGGVGDWNNLRSKLFYEWTHWDVGYIWQISPDSAWNLFPGLREIRLVRPVDVQMRAETTYTGSASAWDGITPVLTYSIGGTAIPAPGLAPAINASAIDIAATQPDWHAGTYNQPVTGLLSNQFNLTSGGALIVHKAKLTVRALAQNKTYDDSIYSGGNGVEITGFVGGEDASVLTGTLTYSGSSQGAHNAGSYTIAPGGLSAANYDITYVSAPLNILPAPLVLMPVSEDKPYDGTTNSPASPGFMAGALQGDDTLTNFVQRYDNANVGVHTLTVDPQFILNDGNGGRNYQVTINNTPQAVPVSGTIVPQNLLVKVNNASKNYDGLPWSGGNGVQYYGFVNGENAAVLGGSLVWGGNAQGASAIGDYTLEVSGLSSPTGNYLIQYQPGTLTIKNRLLTVRANDFSRPYDGSVNHVNNGVTYSGFQDGDTPTTPGILTGAINYSGSFDGAKDAGSYEIIPGGLSSPKYDIVFVSGQLHITPAPLVIKADDKSRDYNRIPFSDYSVTVTGLAPGETLGNLTGTLNYRLYTCNQCWYDNAPLAGNYNILPGGLTSTNYAISWQSGTLDIRRLPLTVTVQDVTKSYDGQKLTDHGFGGVTIAGLLPGDTLEDQVAAQNPTHPLEVVYNYAATEANVGSYPLQARLLKGGVVHATPGYTLVYVDGSFTVKPAPLGITANDDTRPNGSPPYSGGNGVSYTGFVNNETEAVLGGALQYGGSSQGATDEGHYDITPSGLTASNYAITFVSGRLTIGNPVDRYTIAVASSVGGAVTCSATTVQPGDTVTCSVSTDPGYRFDGWTGSCATTAPITAPTCTLDNIQTDQQVGVSFSAITTFSGTTVPTSGAGGTGNASFSGGGPNCRFDPASTAFVAAPQVLPPGQTLPQGLFAFHLLGCNSSAIRMRVTWPEPIADYTKYGKADASATAPAYFAPTNLTQETDGHSASFDLVDGQLGDDDWQVNGVLVDPSGPMAAAAPSQHPITITPTSNGHLSCTPNPVNDGNDSTCTATPDSGYRISDWEGDCSTTPRTALNCVLVAVDGPRTVGVRFEPVPPVKFAITILPTSNGSVVCSPNPVAAGSDATCTAMPAAGYRLSAWDGDCSTTPATVNPCRLAAVNGPRSVGAQFEARSLPAAVPVDATDRRSILLLMLLIFSAVGLWLPRSRTE